MNMADHDCTVVSLRDPLPPRRVIFAMEAMSLQKELYDIHHPEHARQILLSELWRTARNRVVQELSDPSRDRGKEHPR